jgi:hypothetical protein
VGTPTNANTDHAAPISWEEYESIKERFHNSTETQVAEIKIGVRPEYHPGKAGYSYVTPKRKTGRKTKCEPRTGINATSNDSQSDSTLLHRHLAMTE